MKNSDLEAGQSLILLPKEAEEQKLPHLYKNGCASLIKR